MDIKELKDKIEHNKLDNTFFIFVKNDISSDLIIDQYVHKIADNLKLNVKLIDSFSDMPDKSFIKDDNLYVIRLDKFDSEDVYDNCIIVCDSSKNKDAVKFPKLEDWHVVDRALMIANGLNEPELTELIKKYNKNYFRFINDIEKIGSFDKDYQQILFDKMLKDEFSKISNLTIFDFSNALIQRDVNKVREIMKVFKHIDITPMYLSQVLYNNFMRITRIQLDQSCTAASLGISDKQFYVLKKYNCGYYSKDQLISIVKMLTSVEEMFKFNELSIDDLMDYMICKIMGV